METVQGGVPPYGVKETLVVNGQMVNGNENCRLHILRNGRLSENIFCATTGYCLSIYFVYLLYYNSPYVCLSVFANCRSQFLLDRLGRCLKLFVSTDSTSCHEFASKFGLAICIYAKKNQKTIANTESPARLFT